MFIFTPNTLIKSSEVNDNFESAILTVNHSNPYKFSVYRTASYTTIASTWTKFPFNLEAFDTNGDFNTTNNQYTVPVSGYYFISSRVNLEFASLRAIVSIWTSAGVELMRGTDWNTGTASQNLVPIVSGILYLSAGTIIESRYYINSATLGTWTQMSTYFMGHLMSV
jgi:hypothetical protein